MEENKEKKEYSGDITDVKQLQAVFDKHLLMADRGVIPLSVAVTIGNQFVELDPIWMLLIAPPSGGKTEIISSFNNINNKEGIPLFYPISDLTINTFASGQERTGKETSLLNKIPFGGIMSYKDFTSILAKNPEARAEIMGQLREIYDKEYVKRTGTGKDIMWRGKIGALAGCTEALYEFQENLSAMGDRFIMYSILQPDRMEVLKRIMKAKRDRVNKEDSRDEMKIAMKGYVEHVLRNMKQDAVALSEEVEMDIMNVANFSTSVRSGVIIDDRRGHVKFVPSKEMPMRMTEQMLAISTAFIAMNQTSPALGPLADQGNLTQEQVNILYKIALDSIPIKRRMALRALAKYSDGVTTAGLATLLNYQTPVVQQWLSQLNGLGICTREKSRGPQGDKWTLNKEYMEIMVKFEQIKTVEGELKDDSVIEDTEDDWDFEKTMNDKKLDEAESKEFVNEDATL